MHKIPLVLRVFFTSKFLLVLLVGSIIAFAILLLPILRMAFRDEIGLSLLLLPIQFALIGLAFLYGVVRAWHFHPFFDERYHNWLASVPWTSAKPLPKGPLTLTRADAVVIGTMGLLALAANWAQEIPFDSSAGMIGAEPITAFFVAMTLVWTLANGLTGQLAYVHAVLWVPVLFALMGNPPVGFMICPLITTAIAWYGVRRSLQEFPWKDRAFANFLRKSSQRTTPLLGWPYANLLEKPHEIRASPIRAFCEAALVAGWVWLLIESTDDPDVGFLKVFCPTIATLAACARLACYSSLLCANLCWGMRIARKQWIIPRHDQIFVAPLLMIALGWTLLPLFYSFLGFSFAISGGLMAGIVYFVARAMGPNMHELQLTGVHSKFDAPLLQKEVFVANQSKRIST
jgi:hypothetical protein